MDVPFGSLVECPYPWLGGALGVAIASGWTQRRISRRYLRGPGIDRPIVDWELAGAKARLDEILGHWGPRGRSKAALTLLLDVGLIAAFGLGLSLAASLGARVFDDYGWAVVSCAFVVIAWAALAAAALDLIEDVLLGLTLFVRTSTDALPAVVGGIARTKFLLLKVAVPAAVIALLFDLLGCRFGCGRG